MDPNLPADQQPLNDSSNPNPVSRPPVAIRPDRFTPNTTDNNGLAVPGANDDVTPNPATLPPGTVKATPAQSGTTTPAAKKPKPPAPQSPNAAAPKPNNDETPGRNP
jgi:hypothetical protein